MSTASTRTSSITLPSKLVRSALGAHPLLRALLVTAAGCSQKHAGPFSADRRSDEAFLIYCVDGVGWCDVAGQFTTIRRGDLLVLPPGLAGACGARGAKPWSVHWVRAAGNLLRDYIRELRALPRSPVVHVGEDIQLTRLFAEVLKSLQRGLSFTRILHASQALGYALALVINKQDEAPPANRDTVGRVAEAIIYMSEHLEEPLRVSALARLASLSPAYFSGLFKEQTGCAPRDYLHLLRIHRACQLLQSTVLSIKEIARQLGYQDQFHFSRQFKAFQGFSPTEYRLRRHSPTPY